MIMLDRAGSAPKSAPTDEPETALPEDPEAAPAENDKPSAGDSNDDIKIENIPF